jgi:hypothetical protein
MWLMFLAVIFSLPSNSCIGEHLCNSLVPGLYRIFRPLFYCHYNIFRTIDQFSQRAQGGTIHYQAHELHRGGHNALLSDIYAFACVVHQVLLRFFTSVLVIANVILTVAGRKTSVSGIAH